MTVLNCSQNHLVMALNYIDHKPKEEKGALGTLHSWGDKIFVSRKNFLATHLAAVVDLLHGIASALFHSLWAAGTVFTTKSSRELAANDWKDVGKTGVVAFKSSTGIVCPHLAKWIDKNFLPTIKKPDGAGNGGGGG